MKDLSKYGGINMMAYCSSHEEYIKKQLHEGTDMKALYDCHNTKLRYLQHERLIHLLVTILTGIALLLFFCISLLKSDILVYLMLAITIVLFVAYLIYYFRLENRTQRWYILSDTIYRALNNKDNATSF